MDYYKRYMGDYSRDTSRLSMLEHGAYSLLLDDYYSNRAPFPSKIDDLFRICRASNRAERAAVKSVAERFFKIGPDGLRHNKRADEEIAKWEEFAAQNREKGKLGGRPKRSLSDNPLANPTGNPLANPPANPNGSCGETRTITRNVTRTETPPIPIPNPEEESFRNARACVIPEDCEASEGNGSVAPPFFAGNQLDSLTYEQSLMAKFPNAPNQANWQAALRNARDLVDNGLLTWPGVVDVAERYAAYLKSTGATVNTAAHNFYDRRKGDHWQRSWDIPTTKNGKQPFIPPRSVQQLENEAIASAIAAGKTDQEIANEVDVTLDRVTKIRESNHAGH